MKPNKVQTQASYLLTQLDRQIEPEGGMLFFNAVKKCELDYSEASIERLDKLFEFLHQKNITLAIILKQPNHKNFLLTLGFYIGEYIGKLLGETPLWYQFDNFLPFQNNDDVSRIFIFSIVAQYAYGVSLPFGGMLEVIDNKSTIKDYIEQASSTILSNEKVNLALPAPDISNYFLKKVRTGVLIDNTIAYPHLLKKIHFDYSYESLQQIDEMLGLIKTYENLNTQAYDNFVSDPSRQGFIYFVGCYINACAALLAKSMPTWLNYEQTKPLIHDVAFEFCLEHNQVAMFEGNYLRFPLRAVTNYLFDLNSQSAKGAAHYADNVLRENPANLTTYPYSNSLNMMIIGVQPLSDNWERVANLAGTLAAWTLLTVCDAGKLYPTSLEQNNGKLKFINHKDAAIDELVQQLDIPKQTQPFGLLAYDTYVDLPTMRTDAIVIEVRTYDEQNLNISFILPYRYAKHPFGFGIYPLVNHQAHPLPQDTMIGLVKAFYEGAKQFKDPFRDTDYWSTYYINEFDLFAPAAWVTEPIDEFHPNQSDIEILPL